MLPKICLLVCDNSLSGILSSKQTFTDIFVEFLRSSHPNHHKGSPSFILDSYDVVDAQEYPNLDKEQYDGIIISGSVASVYEDLPWIKKLLAWVSYVFATKPKVKLLGFCFGHQIIAQALGGMVTCNENGWELGVTPTHLSDAGKSILGRTDDSGALMVQEIHRDHVTKPPPSFLVLGHSALSPVQGLLFIDDGVVESDSATIDLSSARILTFQGHPEFTKDVSVEIIEAISKLGLASEALAIQGIQRAGDKDQGRDVGRSVWKFLRVH
ncbi:class I glutamine amidotransferase-like protein [Schizopora paradoxa]|uniref:Class I glutamine amidotransferase-like protein n=1 Tax=Schizopora paradoxa TaxID=27342 RepID=A0A0H2S2X5_9AGAM|nr:class I glutamine amidotransferase-like protein [Schizopora paradoxa]